MLGEGVCGNRDIWEISVLSIQFFCESEAALKKEVVFFKLPILEKKKLSKKFHHLAP